MRKRNKILKYLFLNCVVVLISVFVLVVINDIQRKAYINKINKTMNGIVEIIIEKYPEITEEEIIEILNSTQNSSDTLKKYGISNSEISILSLKDNINNDLKINILVLFVLDALLIISFVIYVNNKNKKIVEITKCIDKIMNKDYNLDIEDNSEDELSFLRDELYKITIMLKEESYNAIKEKDSLMKSVADISHQLKTPITSIRIMLDNLEDGNIDDSTRTEFINDISNQIEWMNFLIISLLKLARFDAGVITLKQEEIKLNEILNDVKENLGVILDLKNQKINIKGKKGITFKGDYSWQLEAITNIVKNCLEYSNNNGIVEISYEDNLFYTKIVIKDYGIGIKKEELKYIFDRFYKSSTSNSNSIGIGLSLAKTIIEKGNGYISASSIIGKGTTFEIKYQKNV